MKIVVAHNSPDWDAITSVWLIKRFLPGWEEARIQFVPAGERIGNTKYHMSNIKNTIEKINNNEVIHVDTGLGPLDHHQTQSMSVSAASLAFDYIRQAKDSEFKIQNSEKVKDRKEAVARIVKVIVAIDHFQEVFWENPTADYHELSILGVLEGLKLLKPNQDEFYVEFGMKILDALLRNFENRIWAQKEIKKGEEFKTRWGRGIGFETINDTVLDLAQKMGYMVVVRKDPRKGYVRIKARPEEAKKSKVKSQKDNSVDLTPVYEALKKMDPQASWFLHISKKMLLNGSSKNPRMKSTVLSLEEIINILRQVKF